MKDKRRIDFRIIFLTTIITLSVISCASKNSQLSQKEPYVLKDSVQNLTYLMAALDSLYFPGSGGRPSTATEDRAYRWDVKTMTDDSGNHWQTIYGMPYQRNFTISELLKFKPEEELEEDTGKEFIPIGKIHANTPRLWGNTYLHEYQIISVEAKIIDYRFEDDKDIHLILRDTEGHTLVAEIPHPNEVGPWSKLKVAAVWKWLINHFGPPPTKGMIPPDIGPVFVVGMPFIDKDHNVNGAAPNGIEIHPVLGISLTDDN